MIGWVVETLIATTLLMLLVLAIRKPVRAAFGPRLAYALWALPAMRMILPPLPGNWRFSSLLSPAVETLNRHEFVMGALNPSTMPAAAASHSIATITLAQGVAPIALVPPVETPDGAPLIALFLGLWAVGAVVFFGYHLIAHSRFCRRIIRRAKDARTVAGGRVRVLETDGTSGPLAFGIFRKYVAFPGDFAERYDALERDLALAHELGHHARGDLYANWGALAMLACHWFNPVAWRAFKAFRADQEMACDALVLAGRPGSLRHAYGRAIVKSAHGGAVSAACHLHTINDLKGRLKMLSRNQSRSRRTLIGGAAGLGLVTLAGLGLTASGTSAAETIRGNVENAVGVKLADIRLASVVSAKEMPKPPVAPAAPRAPSAVDAPVAPAAPEAPKAPMTAESWSTVAQTDTVAPVPPVPPAPPVDGVAPPAPPAPPAADHDQDTTRVWTDKDGHRHVQRVIVRTGKDRTAMLDMQDSVLKEAPQVIKTNCGPGTPVVKQDDASSGKASTIIICTDRIAAMRENAERQARAAKAEAKKTERVALQTQQASLRAARRGLDAARAAIAANSELTGKARQEALAGIDRASRKLDAQARTMD